MCSEATSGSPLSKARSIAVKRRFSSSLICIASSISTAAAALSSREIVATFSAIHSVSISSPEFKR